jgi:endoglucanase
MLQSFFTNMSRVACLILLAALLAPETMPAQNAPDAPGFTPENPPGMKVISGRDTPAYRAARNFERGANLGDYLEATPSGHGWGVTVSAGEFADMRREGFDHVRVPVGWQHYAGPAPAFQLQSKIFERADFVVTNALANHLSVIINIHHFDELDHDPGEATEEFLKIWEQIARHYQAYPEGLAFELDNEPHDHATTAVMNPIYARAIQLIRQSNPNRTLFVEPGGWGNIMELKHLELPPDDNVIVSVHCYEPFYFTHQGATWAGPDPRQTGIVFPGPPAVPLVPDPTLDLNPWVRDWIKKYNTRPTPENPCSALAFAGRFKYVRAWSDYYGRPVHLGEFGAYTKADQASRAHYYAAVRAACEAQGIGWCIWDWSAGFRYWDKKLNRPMPGMPQALFGPNP